MEVGYWYIITGMATSFLLCSAILLFYLKYKKNIIQQQYQFKVAEVEHQKELLHSIIVAQEEERKRIAVALHDDVGNRLNVLFLLLNNFEADKNIPGNNVSDHMSETIDILRNISHSLYPVNLESLGLLLYIEELISILSDKIDVLLHVNDNYQRKSIFIEVQLFRIIQEFTTNVIKHSDATEIDIRIRENPENMFLMLSDNGQGFNYIITKKGMGLKNIESRINSMNAGCKWKNVTGKGSRLIIKIPQNHDY